MLKRVLENEAMDSAAEAADYDAMDHGDVNRAFVADLLAALSGERDAGAMLENTLDLGAGTAQIPIELCRQNSAARVHALDVSQAMLELAWRNITRAALAERIVLDRVDAKALPFDDGQFAVVTSNSIVHHLPEPLGALAEAVRVTAPGGLVFMRDLARPADDATVTRLVGTYAAGASAAQRSLFDQSLRAALDLEEIRALVAALGFDPAGVALTSDRHWTWIARKPATGAHG